MGEDRLDKFMKDKVANHQTPVDIDALWQGIQSKQEPEPKPKRRWFLWFSFLGGLLLFTGLGVYAFLGTYEEQIAQDINAELIPSAPKDNGTTADLNKPMLEKEANSTAANSKLNTKTNPTSKTATKPSSTAPQTTSSPSRTNKNLADPRAEEALSSMAPSGPITAASAATGATGTAANTAATTTVASTATKNIKEERLANAATISREHTAVALALLPLKLAELSADTEREDLPQFFFPIAAIIKPRHRSPFSIGAHFDYGIAASQLRSKTSESESYLLRRQELETPQQVISAGVDLQYQFRSGYWLKAGLQYEQITERFDLDLTSEPVDFYNEAALNAINTLADGTTTLTYGTISTRQRVQQRKVYNRYRSIDLPLLVGYSPISSKRWNWFTEAGVLVNLAFIPRGEVLDVDEENVIDLAETDLLKANLGVSLNLGLGLSYRLDKKSSLWLSPRFRYALSSMTSEVYALKQSFVRGGVQVGLRRLL